VDNLLGIVVFLLVLLIIELSNYFILRRLDRSSRPANGPLISVLVPARNEELNIELCLTSILSQDYASFELIVLDDNSTDDTNQILSAMARNEPRLKLMKGQPLPAGWIGKNWACHQLSQAAIGELLLFVDADTQMKPAALRSTVGAMQDSGADLISALPSEEVVSWGEKFIVPIIHWSIFCIIPLALAYAFRISALAISNGQFMCFKRTAYVKFGGHAAVRKAVVEDKAISRLISRGGMRWRLMDGTGALSCRMYRSSKEAAEGLIKNLFPFFGYNIPFFIFVWIWLIVVFWQPIISLIMLGLGVGFPESNIVYAWTGIGLAILLWAIFYKRFGFPLYLVLLYPITQIVISSVAMFSLIRNLKRNTTWKGRVLAR
jgi:chlorobactene glucosyltransferase